MHTREITFEIIISFPAASRITGRLRPVNSKRRRRMALLSIDVKFGTVKDYRISQSLAEFHRADANI